MKKCVLIFALGIFVTTAQAQTSTTTMEAAPKQESTLKLKKLIQNKKFEDDKEITDTKLRADSGSRSKYSLKFALSYAGPPVGDLGARTQPNPDGTVGVFETSLGGSISGRYRLDSQSAVSVGTGITALTPFHGTERLDVKNPFISYDLNDRMGGVQMRHSFGYAVTTVPNYRSVGQYGSAKYDHSMVHNFGASGWAVGLDTGLDLFFFERDYQPKDRKSTRYHLGFYPQVKYNFSDKVNIYSSLAMNYWNPRSEASEGILRNKKIGQRVGMGIGFTRDIYFAPYLNFYPDNPRWDTTTLSVATVFSLL